MTSVLDRVADHLEEQANPPFLAKIRDWRESDCTDPTRLPSPDLAPHWVGDGPCGSCAHCRPEQRLPEWAWDVWLYLAGRGCVAPWTRVYLPAEDRWERIDALAAAGRSIDVLALGEDGPVVARTDGAPFLKGHADYWEVTLEGGQVITVTDQHRFLTPQGWRPLASVRVGQLLAAEPPETPGQGAWSQSGSPRRDNAAREIRYPRADITSWSRVVHVRHAGSGPYYDLTVPGAASYLAECVWNHNSGKTRSAAEHVASLLALNRRWRIALVAPTYADARDTMVEGESGLISVFDRWGWIEGQDYVWNRSLGELVVRSTRSRVKLYSGEKPARLRGPQHHFAWVDELAQVVRKAPDAWDMLRFGLRLGRHPRAICTTTPLPLQLLRDMIDDPRVAVARGRTDDNKANLPAVALQAFHDKYDGTALGAQELDGDLIDHMPGALWQLAWIARNRIKVSATADWAKDPQETTQAAARAIVAELAEQGITLTRIVIGVDPAVTSGEEADESGIIVVGRATNGRYYVLADYTIRDTPDTTVEKTLQAYDDWEANTVILEVNNGGEWIPSMVKKTCKLEKRPIIPMEIIRAKKGKRVRAEPVSGEYERNQVHHVGVHKKLEDQVCTWLPESIKSPDRMDGLVYGCLYLSDHGIPSQLATASTVAGSLPRHQMLRPTTMPTTSVGSRSR